jgi:outer membrane murein-binding lipoprotein Lpp
MGVSVAFVASVFAIVLALLTIAGMVFALGKRDAKIDQLEARAAEDRKLWLARYAELDRDCRAMNSNLSSLTTLLQTINDRLVRIEDKLDKDNTTPRGGS